MNVLGLSCFYHDSAACLIRDGEIAAAIQEERLTRSKSDAAFPVNALNACLQRGGVSIFDIDYVVFYEKPFLKLHRVLIDHVRNFPFSYRSFMRSMPRWLSERLDLPLRLEGETGYKKPVLFVKHHLAHAASTFLASPFEEAAILTMDGVGEHATTTFGTGTGSRIELNKEIRYPHSMGLVYSALTDYLGFEANRAEGKVMALADYGEPAFLDKLRTIIRVASDGSFHVDPSYFGWIRGRAMYSQKFVRMFGPPRIPKSVIEQRHKDMAASLQKLLEEVVLTAARHVHKQTGRKKLCFGGGVALNCVANDRLLADGPFEDIFVPPATGDAGTAIGAAAYAWTSLLGNARPAPTRDAYLGQEYTPDKMRRSILRAGLNAQEMDEPAMLEHVARRIGEGRVVGWFQERMEFGPRALGHRSILADPRVPGMKDRLNEKVKHRESFRPYGASVLQEEVGEWFVRDRPSSFMLFAYPVRPEKKDLIPSAVHVNGTCRLQTVTEAENGLYYRLIKEFRRQTGVPMILNTSFNDNNEPIVCSPDDACACFTRTQMDTLVIGRFVVDRA